MTPASFLQFFPEFEQTSPTLVAAALARAAAHMGGPDTTVWGPLGTASSPPSVAAMTQADIAQGNLAAHYLVASPFGTSTLLVAPKSGKSSSIYLETFEDIQAGVACAGGMVVSGGS